jgi:UDP-GlcNAc:undecaprenyl-phosphate/decaprenyl-phosphate GlcNAc-1-phosphate transferase
MNAILELVLPPLAVAGFVAYLLTPLVIKLAWKIGIVDDPAKNKHPKVIHTYPVPRGGGLAIFAGFIVATLFFLPYTDKHVAGIIIGAFVVVLLGLADDKFNINPYLRLAVQFAAAAIPIAAGIGIAFITNPLGGTIDLSMWQINIDFLGFQKDTLVLADVFALFWIVFMMNMLNMGAKGVDGQLSGVATVAALTIAALSLRYSADIAQWPVIVLASITAGAYLGFLPWHFYPQKIMPSYSGATLAGYLLAILSILSTTKVGTLVVVLGIPLVDTGYTIIRRVLSGKSPVWGDRGHLHHKLFDSGLSKKRIAYFYWITAGFLGATSLSLNSSYKLYTIVGIIFAVGGMLLWLNKTLKPKKG